jgi:signal transduction histidine kinase/CheY-like chemotaxis protein
VKLFIVAILFFSTIVHAEYLRTIRIGTYPDEASAKVALEKLQKFVNSNETIKSLQQEWDFVFKERQSGKYFITLGEPFRDREVLQTVLDNLRKAYPDVYVTRLKSYKPMQKKASQKNTVIKRESDVVVKEPETATPQEVEKNIEKEIQKQTPPAVLNKEEIKKRQEPLRNTESKEVVPQRVKKETLTQKQQTFKLKEERKNYLHDYRLWWALLFVAGVLLIIFFLLYKRANKRAEEAQMKNMMLQEQLDQANQKLQNKDRVFSHTSHELRSPMTAILGLSHLLLEEEGMPIKQKEYVKKIEGSAKYLLEIINDILDLSKMEAGALKIEQREFNLNRVVRHVVNIVSVAARENGTRIELDISHKVPPYIVGDSLRLTQILVNLLSNAVKFTKNGVVVLDIRKTSQYGDTLTLEFRVRDNGIGMTEAQLKNIFNSYAQASESTSREYGGTGLGLSIVKYLVDLMKGDIHVESKKHHGTLFIVHLKFSIQKEKEKRFYRLPSREYLDRRVLLVDKSQKNIQKLQEAFGYFNYTVHVIPSFKDSVLDGNILFDIVVVNKEFLDDEAIEIIKGMKAKSGTKFILFSDSVLEIDTELLNRVKVDAHLSRPFTQDDILNILKSVCDVKNKEAKEEQPLESKIKLQELGKKRILIAEDNKVNHKVLKGLLSDTDMEIIFAEDGLEVLDIIKNEEQFDLILLDINMPQLNGYDTAKEIRKIGRYSKTPILALTADVMQNAIDKAMLSGMQGHIAKPIIVNEFYEKLYYFLTQKPKAALEYEQQQNSKQKVYQEFSIEKGLENTHGDKRLYKTLLLEFVNGYKNSAATIAELLKVGKFKEARIMAMDVKDVALNIGAYKLYENAAAMQYTFEKASRGNYKEVLGYYEETLNSLIKEIKHYLQHES